MNPDFLRVQRGFTEPYEGGYVNNPADRGGETNLGVTIGNWAAWCRANGLPQKPMHQLTEADVLPLYEAWYWRPLAGKLPWPLSAAIYDMSVNHGLGDCNPDDENGKEQGATYLLWRAKQMAQGGTPLQVALAACDARVQFYQAIVQNNPSQRVFLKGWLARADALREWLKANAQPTSSGLIFIAKSGEEVGWNGQPTTYASTPINAAFVAILRQLYPQAGGPWQYSPQLRVWLRKSGEYVLERIN